eukprot:jgi/Mesvir1/14363/Mv09766-RA.1
MLLHPHVKCDTAFGKRGSEGQNVRMSWLPSAGENGPSDFRMFRAGLAGDRQFLIPIERLIAYLLCSARLRTRHSSPCLPARRVEVRNCCSQRHAPAEENSIEHVQPQSHALGVLAPLATASALTAQAFAASPAMAAAEQADSFPWIVLGEYLGLAGFYFIAMPPLIFYYYRMRYTKKSSFETGFMYFLMFFFFPGILLWSPFINLRPDPRDNGRML